MFTSGWHVSLWQAIAFMEATIKGQVNNNMILSQASEIMDNNKDQMNHTEQVKGFSEVS